MSPASGTYDAPSLGVFVQSYLQLMQAPAPFASMLAVGVIDGFLEWTKQHRSPRTYEWYLEFLQSFITSLCDNGLSTDEFKQFHVHHWV